jgi:hypothetical protein
MLYFFIHLAGDFLPCLALDPFIMISVVIAVFLLVLKLLTFKFFLGSFVNIDIPVLNMLAGFLIPLNDTGFHSDELPI